MTLCAILPKHWVATSNGISRRIDNPAGEGSILKDKHDMQWFLDSGFYDSSDLTIYEFEETAKISTYLYAFCCGDYVEHVHQDLRYAPQRIYVRHSLDKNLDKEKIFGITKTTFDFYTEHFGHRYPFSKLDHVFCPDYKYGAMENVGCITYADSIMCEKSELSIPEQTFYTVVVQHEIAHMWFGNLVTMEWWDDLWLNEAFATCLSYKACSVGGPFVDSVSQEAWLHMAGYKRYGLNDDLLPTTHNIQADCKSTDDAESLIDGITYGKGSSMIKQLIFLLSWENFSKGLHIYFKRHAWSNTRLEDFILALQEAYNANSQEPIDLLSWAKIWLQTKGPSKFALEYDVQDGKVQNARIKQTFCKYGDEVYRWLKINIGLFSSQGEGIEYSNVERIHIQAQEYTEVPQLNGKAAPDAFLLNSEDWGFGVFLIDEKSQRWYE